MAAGPRTQAISPGEQVTLITDGVIEARDKTGALFGFDRTASLSIQPAETIARAAQTFGQEDDLTALTLMATATPQPALACAKLVGFTLEQA